MKLQSESEDNTEQGSAKRPERAEGNKEAAAVSAAMAS